MPPYRHSDKIYLYNVVKMMEQHGHKQLFLHQCEMYITVSYNRDFTELQMSWHDHLTNRWCYAKFPFEFNGTTALYMYVNKNYKVLQYSVILCNTLWRFSFC